MKVQWKCAICGYQLEGSTSPPEICPGCGSKCTFIDATTYIPELEGTDRDRRV